MSGDYFLVDTVSRNVVSSLYETEDDALREISRMAERYGEAAVQRFSLHQRRLNDPDGVIPAREAARRALERFPIKRSA